MTETYGFFASGTGDARAYDQAEFAAHVHALTRNGIARDTGSSGCIVGASIPAALSVSVGTGRALIQGYWYDNDALVTLALSAAHPSNPRIDRVVLRLDELAGRTITALVKTGTPAATPVATALTQSGGIYEIAIADIEVRAGVTTIIATDITDQRWDDTLCGIAEPIYVTDRCFYPIGPVLMNGQTISNLGTPTADTDAATKEYVDTVVTPGGGGGGGGTPGSFVAGMMIDWGGNLSGLTQIATAPNGREILGLGTPVEWLYCNGADVSRTTYDDLFAAIGSVYGTATNGTVFCLPKATGNVTGYYFAGGAFDPIGSTNPPSELHFTPATGAQTTPQWLVVGGKLIKT